MLQRTYFEYGVSSWRRAGGQVCIRFFACLLPSVLPRVMPPVMPEACLLCFVTSKCLCAGIEQPREAGEGR